MRVLLIGDTHANRSFTTWAIQRAAQFGCHRVVQVGDFGFWPRSKGGPEFLAAVRKELWRTELDLVFVRGNHEDHDELDRLGAGPTARTEEGFLILRKSGKYGKAGGGIFAAPRSGNWEWGGVRFGCLGGAYSIDRRWRTVGVNWFPQEMPTFADADRLRPCEVLLTHDTPNPLLFVHPLEYDTTGDQAHVVLREAVKKARPSLLVHGHWHASLHYRHEDTQCVGLDADVGDHSKAVIVLDTETKMWFTLNQMLYEGEGTPWRVS